MTPESPKRKLAAIMFTDMVGYTALMQSDEPKARELIERQREILTPFVKKHDGEVLQYVGDGTFCTFNSAIEAVNCAVEIQGALLDEKEIKLRIGIHVGDVVAKGEEVYGDGVNVASRLEPLAKPGGVCISGRVYDDIRNQPDIDTTFLGEKVLKNVDHPIKIYCLTGEGLKAAMPFEDEEKAVIESKEVDESISKPASKKMLSWAAGAAVLLILFFAKGWFSGESSITEVTADENSLAIMFIENMMDPSDSERHAEMIKELLITDLSQSHDLRIIGGQRLYDIAKRNRKGEDRIIDRSNASEVAREAGARWMLVGKLSRIGSQMVLTTQIEGVRDGKIVDSQRADGNDLFALVDMLTKEVKADLGFVSKLGEIDAPVKEITTNSSEAYQLYLEGLDFLNGANYGEAIDKFEHAIELDPTFTKALYKLAVAQWWFNPGDNLPAKETVKQLLLIKESLAEGELLLVEGLEAQLYRRYSEAIDIYQSLLMLYPDEKEIHYGLGEAYFHSSTGEQLKALAAFEEALNLDPEFTLAYVHTFDIYLEERMENRGIRVANRLIKASPDNGSGYRYLADIYGLKGELDKSIKNYEKAAELNKGNYDSIVLQAWAYRIGGKYEEALNEYSELFKADVSADWQYLGKRLSSYVYAEQGKFKDAIQLTREAIIIGQTTDDQNVIRSLRRIAEFYSSIGDTVRAFAIIDSALAMNPHINQERFLYRQKGNLYARNGNQEEVKKLLDTINLSQEQEGVSISRAMPIELQAELFRLQGNVEKAFIEYDKFDYIRHLFKLELKATLYADTNDWENVILTANEMQSSFLYGNIILDFRRTNYPRSFYIRGKAYEEMGKPELAIENYEALLDLWKDADEEIPERRDTIKRLAVLKKGS